MRQRLTGFAIPDDDCLTLIRNSNRVRSYPGLSDRHARCFNCVLKDLRRVVLNPTGPGKVLRDLSVSSSDDPTAG
jgi:hypothetical protein